MMRGPTVRLLGLLAATTCLALPASNAQAVTRAEVMVRARAFANHPWRCTTANLTASCSSSYHSVYKPGDYVGLPYDWGGYMSLFTFDQQLAAGAGAGSYPRDGILDCTVGLDCSGYVSRCWGTGHLTTSTLHQMSNPIQLSEVLPGDAFNQAGYHVILFSHRQSNGVPVLYEAIGYNVHVNKYGGWNYVNGYKPMRLQGITGTSAPNPPGTPTNPIDIGSFPYSHDGDTSKSPSDALDGCAAASSKPEAGPEEIYRVKITKPGVLTASVSDDVGVDVDVHLYTSLNTSDCKARNDQTISVPVDCGEYYIVVDTYGPDESKAGRYTLTVDFQPDSGKSCGSGPPSYHPKGRMGDACSFPGHEDLPFCNPNLGGEVCIYTSGQQPISFCSRPCEDTSDCGEFQEGCCQDLGKGEKFCVIASLCHGSNPDAGPGDAAPTDGASADGAPMDGASEVDAADAGGTGDASVEAGTEASSPDAGTSPPGDSGGANDGQPGHDNANDSGPGAASAPSDSDDSCSCTVGAGAGGRSSSLWWLLLAAGSALWIRKRARSIP